MKRFVLAALLATTTGMAHADEISLSAPLAGATLQEGGVDMSVYWTENGARSDVTAIYAAPHALTKPSRLQMTLVDGDQVAFALPDEPGVMYKFARTEGVVTVSARRVWNQFASR